MNYIQKLMDDYGLVVGTPFQTSLSKRVWFCFTDDYRLDVVGEDEILREITNCDGILLSLLRGTGRVTIVLGR